jgi:hypothetical protein
MIDARRTIPAVRTAICAAVAALVLAPSGASASPPFRLLFRAPTHTPKVNAKWRYEVRVTDLRGAPIRGLLTLQIVDPFGGKHPVEFDCCKRNIVNHPFRGVFRDAAEFPPESRGFRLTFRVTVRALGATRVVSYWVKSV